MLSVRVYIAALLCLFLSIFASPLFADDARKVVRVGTPPVEPLVFSDSDGQAHGLYPDLLRKIAEEEQWDIEFVAGSWSEGLKRLESGQIDLMTTIGYSKERDKLMDFSREPFAELWGQVFSQPKRPVEAILDLHGEKVAIMRRDINARNFIKAAEGFGVTCEYVEVATHNDVFSAVQQGIVLAGVAPHHYGLRHAKRYDLVASSIQFSPYPIYCATKQDKNPELLIQVDSYLTRWKRDKNSYYYDRLGYWLGGKEYARKIIPPWLLYSLGAIATLALTLGIFTRVLNARIKRATLALQRSEKEYRELVECAINIILRLDKQGNILFINHFGLDCFGYSKDDLLGKNVIDTIIPREESTGRNLEKMVATILANPDQYAFSENENIRKDGSRMYVQWSNRAILDEDGNFQEILTIGTDITARKTAELEVAKRKAEFEAIFNAISDAVIFADLDRRIIMVNRSFSAMTGYSSDEAVGRSGEFLYAHPEEFVRQGEQRYHLEAESKQPTFVTDYHLKDGGTFPGETYGTVVRGADGTIIGFLAIIRDISKEVAAEEEKDRLEAQLLQAYKMDAVGTLAGGIAHDFNNILGIILSNTDMALQLITQEDKGYKNIEQIFTATQRAKELVRQILAFSRQEKARLVPMALADTIEETLKLLRATTPATIEFSTSIAPDCTKTVINAEPTQVQQLLINLCMNSVHAMDGRGQLKIELSRHTFGVCDLPANSEISYGDYLHLAVSDTGCGMPEEIHGKIFDPFFTTKGVGVGTGLGLSVVHGVVKNYNGAITVDSVPGEGTTFHIYFPITESFAVKSPARSDEVVGGDERILFVDDEESLAYSCKELLELHGFNVTSTTSSREALDIFSTDPTAFDLVFTDQTMPELTGVELATQLREIRADIPIILCSGYAAKGMEKEALDAGISKVCMKPLNMNQLVRAAREVLDNR